MIVRFIRVINKKKNRGYSTSIIAWDLFLRILFFVIKVTERGIPFCKNWGFPNCPPGTSQIRNSLPKTSVITLTVEYHS